MSKERKIIRQIHFTGKNLNDVFTLSCVKSIIKTEDGSPVLILDSRMVVSTNVCLVGDMLREWTDEKWEVDSLQDENRRNKKPIGSD